VLARETTVSGAHGLVSVLAAPRGTRLRALVRAVAPPPAAMRGRYVAARRGRRGLAAAYAGRAARFARDAPRAARLARRALRARGDRRG